MESTTGQNTEEGTEHFKMDESQPITEQPAAAIVDPAHDLPAAESTGTAKLEEQLTAANEKYLRLFSEFDNYKKRTAKERIELSKTAGEDIFKSLLPVLDDFERGMKAMKESTDVTALKEGVELIFNKFKAILTSRGLEPMTATGEVFNPDIHEAITNIPAPTAEMKGKVIDEVERGYALQGKVIRYAKVIVGN